jgi:biopolymer transport protein ExbD
MTGSPVFIAMADVVFLLLIFFLLSTSFFLQTGGKGGQPRADAAPPEELEIILTADGGLSLGGLPVPWDDLPARLGERLRASASKRVVIRGDAAVALGRTVEVMELARQLGAAELAITAAPGLGRR